MSEWVKIGVIGVDAGLCWIGDPCYILHKDKPYKAIGKDWPDFCDKLPNDCSSATQFNYDLGHAGLGVVVSTGLGDGCYNVYVKYKEINGWGKRIAEVKVVFIGDEEDEDSTD